MKYNYDDLCGVLDKLLSENGCPWDKKQTHESLKICLLEECYEVLDAIDKDDERALVEELGDVLLQVVFHGKLLRKKGYEMNDITDGICKKLINRHPHIFSNPETLTANQVLDNWEEIKREEKGIESVSESMLLIPKAMPQTMRAQKVLKKGAKAGFENGEEKESVCRISELLDGFSEEGSQKEERLGLIMLEVTKLANKNQINLEFALTNALEQFITRFGSFENRA